MRSASRLLPTLSSCYGCASGQEADKHSQETVLVACPLSMSQRVGVLVDEAFWRILQGSATLSMAYAGALFADACIRGLNGEPGVEEYAFVESRVVGELPFFSSKVKLGPAGKISLRFITLRR